MLADIILGQVASAATGAFVAIMGIILHSVTAGSIYSKTKAIANEGKKEAAELKAGAEKMIEEAKETIRKAQEEANAILERANTKTEEKIVEEPLEEAHKAIYEIKSTAMITEIIEDAKATEIEIRPLPELEESKIKEEEAIAEETTIITEIVEDKAASVAKAVNEIVKEMPIGAEFPSLVSASPAARKIVSSV